MILSISSSNCDGLSMSGNVNAGRFMSYVQASPIPGLMDPRFECSSWQTLSSTSGHWIQSWWWVLSGGSLSFSFTGRPLIAHRPVKEKERIGKGLDYELFYEILLWFLLFFCMTNEISFTIISLSSSDKIFLESGFCIRIFFLYYKLWQESS